MSTGRMRVIAFMAVALVAEVRRVGGLQFVSRPSCSQSRGRIRLEMSVDTRASSAANSLDSKEKIPISSEWELDCFSRPVLKDGKKLWELLVCDSTGQWQEVVELPASSVNSVKVREAVESVIAQAPVKPTIIRYFRRQMVNMLSIALGATAQNRAGLRVLPSRTTHALFSWLEERQRSVYPEMEGYDRSLSPAGVGDRPAALAGAASRLPDGLRGEKYAFVTLPLSEILPGGGVNAENVGVGRLIDAEEILQLNNQDDAVRGISSDTRDYSTVSVPGVALLSRRAEPLAMSLASIELAAVRADPSTRQLVLDVGLDDSYLLARLDEDQRDEAAAFDKAKSELNGIHFVVVQRPDDDEIAPAGFWLLRDVADLPV